MSAKMFLFTQIESSNNAKVHLQTLEALKTVLNLSSNKRFNADIMDKVMTMLEEQPSHIVATSEASHGANKETRQSNQLLDIVGDILQQVTNISGLYFILYFLYTTCQFILSWLQIVRSGGSNADVWGLYARWHKTKGNLMACSEALLKQVRSLQVHSSLAECCFGFIQWWVTLSLFCVFIHKIPLLSTRKSTKFWWISSRIFFELVFL